MVSLTGLVRLGLTKDGVCLSLSSSYRPSFSYVDYHLSQRREWKLSRELLSIGVVANILVVHVGSSRRVAQKTLKSLCNTFVERMIIRQQWLANLPTSKKTLIFTTMSLKLHGTSSSLTRECSRGSGEALSCSSWLKCAVLQPLSTTYPQSSSLLVFQRT